jgi:putative transposase
MRENFSKGEMIVMGGRHYSIEQRLPTGEVQLKDIALNTYSALPIKTLTHRLFEGHLEFRIADANLVKKSEAFLKCDLQMLEEKTKKKYLRRRAYVCAIYAHGIDRKTAKVFKPLIEVVSKEIGDENPPSPITLYRWVRRYVASGDNLRSQIPMHSESGRHDYIDPEVDEFIDKAIAKIYMNEQRLTPEDVWEAVKLKVEEENKYRDEDDKLKAPSLSTVYRRLKRINPYDVAVARYGKRFADAKFGVFKQGVRPTRPLERVEMDHTKLDLFVIDDETCLPIGRPWLTVAIDKLTKTICGMFISFEPPSHLSVMQCLLHAIMPKSYVKEKYPSIKNSWDNYGIMEWLVVDNAAEFISSHLEDAGDELGFKILYQKVRKPWYKATVERYFKTLNRQLLHKQSGTTFSSFLDLEDYDPKKNAIINYTTLLEVAHKWIIDRYHQKPHKGIGPHRGIGDIPHKAWQRAVKVFPPALPCNRESLNVLLGMIIERTIQNEGIEFEVLFYADETLAGLRRNGKKKVKCKVNPSDLGFISVFDTDKKGYVPVVSVNPEYTSGLTLWQHRVIRKYARERLEGETDVISLLRAKEEIQAIVERDWLSSRTTTHKQKMARFKQVGLTEHKTLQATDESELSTNSVKQLDPSRSLVMTENTGEALAGCAAVGKVVPMDKMVDFEHSKGHIVYPESKGKGRSSDKRKSKRVANGSSNEQQNLITAKGDSLIADQDKTDFTGWDADYSLPGARRSKNG